VVSENYLYANFVYSEGECALKKRNKVLVFAALYNLLWGAFVVLFPNFFFDWAGLERLNYPQIWQCVGMIVGVYGVGYWIASRDPIKHWPIVMVGFLGKIFGPIGFLQSYVEEVFNAKFFTIIIFNDLIWWVPFFLLLKEAYKKHAFKE
jgi:small multidrug resistance pump